MDPGTIQRGRDLLQPELEILNKKEEKKREKKIRKHDGAIIGPRHEREEGERG